MAAFTALAIAGLALQAYGAVKSAKDAKKAGTAQQQAAESEAQIADYNAGIAELQAKDAIERGAETESRFRTQVRGLVGSQRAGVAAGNIDVGYGSAVDTQADAAYLGELDAQNIRTNAAREAWGFNVQATDLRKRAAIARKTGYYAGQAGKADATTAYIKGAGQLALGTAALVQQRYGYNSSTRPPTGGGFVAENDQFGETP
jgi:hypothetical protein